MAELLYFVIEKSITASVAIFVPVLVWSYLAGPVLIKAGADVAFRVVIYSIVGMSAGLWSYAVFDIPDRRFENWEILSLGVGMFAYCFLFVGPIVILRTK